MYLTGLFETQDAGCAYMIAHESVSVQVAPMRNTFLPKERIDPHTGSIPPLEKVGFHRKIL